jgi:hypothetical protein
MGTLSCVFCLLLHCSLITSFDSISLSLPLYLLGIESNCATVSLQGTHAIRFFRILDPGHMPPHRVAFMRLTRLLEQAVCREFHRIVRDNALLYGLDFALPNSDFYTNKERGENFGCLVSNMLLQQYVFKVSFLCCFDLFGCFHLTLSLSLLSSGAGRSTSVC